MRFFPEKLAEPLRRRTPSGIFVGDMGDIAYLTNEQIAAIFGVAAACPQHRFYILSKAAKRMREWFAWMAVDRGCSPSLFAESCAGAMIEGRETPREVRGVFARAWPLPNVWLGTSVCTQEDADRNIPELLATPAAVRFLSVEPLLGPVDLTQYLGYDDQRGIFDICPHGRSPWNRCDVCEDEMPAGSPGWKDLGIGWCIVGCESGPHARPMDAEWAESILKQCQAAGVPFFFKQAVVNGHLDHEPVLDGRTWREMPETPPKGRR